MAERSIYKDIAERTGGDIYIGVVGPVRSGKSTFITRFMQELVLPNMTEEYKRERARDEMPQSAAGMTVMTTEPKFVPDEAVGLTLEEGVELRVKMIDCVGYMIEGALGGEENGEVRMVRTPWREEPMPFGEAAELGTRKVMEEHATIGVLVSTDGSIGELPRTAYEEAEERLVRELKQLGKPFLLLLNSADPAGESAVALASELEKRYGIPVAVVNCLTLGKEDICGILSMILNEFPVTSVGIDMPRWMRALDAEHPIKKSVMEDICRLAGRVFRMGEVIGILGGLSQNECVESVCVQNLDMGTGRAELSVALCPELYYQVLSEITGEEIGSEEALFRLVADLSEKGRRYDRVSEALATAEERGYGIVMPSVEDLRLEKPAIVRQSGGFGVRLRAAARSIHMIRADIETELNPIVGTEQQSEEFLKSILAELEEDPKKLWESNMFGKSLYELVGEGIRGKLANMPEEARGKLCETLERIVNEGSNGLICILL
ncbi:MAG: stage IV sporulation protein A [Ruminococcaceae bacterium]|nr:stage IV sporulation protein A [Oscillospiraceae bacterium]